MLVRASDLRQATSGCWYFYNGPTVGCVLEVKDDGGRPLGYLVLEGSAAPEDRTGKVQHGVSVIPTVKDLCV